MILNKSIQEKLLLLSGINFFIAMLLIGFSALFYPGGSVFDSTQIGFNYLTNFISDLGMIFAENGELNITSRTLFFIAIILMAINSIILFTIYPNYLNKEKKAIKILVILGTILSIIFSSFFILFTIITKENYPDVHNYLAYAAECCIAACLIIFAIASYLDKELPRRFGHILIFLVVYFLSFAVLVGIGDQLEYMVKWRIRILGHHLLVNMEFLVFGIFAILLWRYSRKSKKIDKSIVNNPNI